MESNGRDVWPRWTHCEMEQLSSRPVAKLQTASIHSVWCCARLFLAVLSCRSRPQLFPPQPQSIHTLADSRLSLCLSSCFYRYGKWIHAGARRKLSSIRKLLVLALVSTRTVTDTNLQHKQDPCCWFCIESRQIILEVNWEQKFLMVFTSNVVLLFQSRFVIGMISIKKVLICMCGFLFTLPALMHWPIFIAGPFIFLWKLTKITSSKIYFKQIRGANLVMRKILGNRPTFTVSECGATS